MTCGAGTSRRVDAATLGRRSGSGETSPVGWWDIEGPEGAGREGSQTQWSLPVSPHAPGTAWYRFRATFSQRWGAYLSVLLLIGLVGGVATGSLAAARRTEASFSTFLASTNPPDLGVTIYGANANNASSNPNYSSRLTDEIAHLPDVRNVEAGMEISAAPLRANGAPRLKTIGLAYPIASVDGLFFDQNRVA